MWDQIQQFEQFERWWPWFRASNLEGEGISEGSKVLFKIVSSLPFEMNVEAHITEAEQPSSLTAAVTGDLEGTARLDFTEVEDGTDADVSWDIEMKNSALRAMASVTRPVVKGAHDWAVKVAVEGFRRHISGVEVRGSSPRRRSFEPWPRRDRVPSRPDQPGPVSSRREDHR
jgi:hypothetical protein